MIPKSTNFNTISCIISIMVFGIFSFAMGKGVHSQYHRMEANSTKVFELRDFNVINGKENTYLIEDENALSIQIISSEFPDTQTIYRLVRYEVSTPNLWLPQNSYAKIQSRSVNKTQEYEIFVKVRLSKTKWLTYGLVIFLSSIAIFGSVFYIFSK